MQAILLGNTKGEEREELKDYILRNKKLLDILSKMLYNMLNEVELTSEKDYTNSGWAYLQAHKNGKKEVIQRLLKVTELSDFTEKDKTIA